MNPDQIIPELKTITIGRHPSNEIVLDGKDISSFHANLIIISKNTFVLFENENSPSKNGTFVNNLRIQRKLISKSDLLRFGNLFETSVENLLKQVVESEKANEKKDLDYSLEFSNLKELYENYPELRKACKNRDKAIRLWSVIGGSAIAVMAITPAFAGVALLTTISRAGISILIPTLASTLLRTEEKLEILDREFKDSYCCPNPECKDPFGNKPWQALANQKNVESVIQSG